jgi:hypothetical protein
VTAFVSRARVVLRMLNGSLRRSSPSSAANLILHANSYATPMSTPVNREHRREFQL